MAVNGVELKIGQRWMTASGDVGILLKTEGKYYPWALDLEGGSGAYTYSEDGQYDTAGEHPELNLNTLLGDSATESDKYSLEEISVAFTALDWCNLHMLEHKLQELKDPEYIEYLRLKNKFDTDEN